MPTPYTRTEAPPAAPGARPRLERPLAGRWLGGVCVGIAEHLGMPVKGIRWAFVILVVLGGGLPAYLFLWAVTPESRTVTALDPASGAPAPVVGRALAGLQRSRQGALVATGVLVAAVGALIALQAVGLDVRASLLVPLLLVAAGAVVVWSDLDAAGRARALDGAGSGQRGIVWLRIGLGVTLAIIGLTVIATRGSSPSVVVDSLWRRWRCCSA